MGERVVRFAPHPGAPFVDVCSLCQDEALEHGWLKEGAPSTPLVATENRRRALDLRSIFGAKRMQPEEPVAPEPILRLSGAHGDLVITVAWEISWYQYRVSPDSAQPVRLEDRGHELDEIDSRYRGWNARVEQEGRLVPDIARL